MSPSHEKHDSSPGIGERTLTWLHLSDLHCCEKRTNWDAARVLRALSQDLVALRDTHGLAPDLLLFTGDAAFGELPGSPIAEQFAEARRFFDGLGELCGLAPERVFLVPGNHDVHRGEITDFDTGGLAGMEREAVVAMIRDAPKDWRRVMERLDAYRDFLESAGYSHLLGDRERLIYNRRLEVRGIDVGVAGLNSAWSCHGDDKGELWLGGEWQVKTAENGLLGADVVIGLIHHPLRWFRAAESEEDLELQFKRIFDFHLHGHEHKPWVHPLDGGTVRIAAGACYDRGRRKRPAGYNLVRLDFAARRGEVWLRQYQEDTAQWIPHHIAGATDQQGIWNLEDLRCFGEPDAGEDDDRHAPRAAGGIRAEGGAILTAWRHQVERANANVNATFERPGSPRLLDHVYVELRLVDRELARLGDAKGQAPAEDGRLGPVRKLGGRLTLDEVLALDPADFAADAVTGRWLLYGDPGSGKTTLLRHLAWKLARDGAPWVPVFASLPRLARSDSWFLDALCAEHGPTSLAPAALRDALDAEGRAGRLLLLFDGLDEVPPELSGRSDALLGEGSDRWPGTPIVVTSRPIGGHRPGPDFRELELLPFAEADRRELLEKWLGDAKRARAALERVRSEPAVWELAGNPLYLTLLAMLLSEKVDIPERRAALYDRIFGYLLRGKHRKEKRPIPRTGLVREVLRKLADEMTEADRDAESVESLEERLWNAEGVTKELGRVERWRERPGVFLEDVAEKTSILAPHDGPDADWRYWHRTFREALAAEALKAELEDDGEEAILERARRLEGNLGRWAEPYALLVGQVDAPDALVKTLMEVNRPLGLRALATSQGLAEETIDEVLGLTEEWKERAEVFRRIPELLGDAESSLRLIERLRRRTSDVHDLYFLEESARLVGTRWPKSARAASKLRGRFFTDRDPPPDGLFSQVETPRDGRVPLWREIPGGTFMMGSPDSEPDYDEKEHPLGAFSDERPQHQVRISTAFRMMSVPVTNAMYESFDPSHEPARWEGVPPEELVHHPVVNVDWYEAVAFCRWLRRHGFPEARLPTEAEWEFTCRAGTTTRFWSGDREEDLARVGWYEANAPQRGHRVGEKPANPWGLYDVHGNVWEWCGDGWDEEAYAKRAKDPRAIDPATEGNVWDTDAYRYLRGGAWGYPPRSLRAAYRVWSWLGHRNWGVGFRVCGSGPEHD